MVEFIVGFVAGSVLSYLLKDRVSDGFGLGIIASIIAFIGLS